MTLRHAATRALSPLHRPARGVIGMAGVGAGAVLFFAPLGPRGVAVVAGIGLVLAGAAALLLPAAEGGRRVTARALGALGVAMGGVIAAWPEGGAPWLAWLIGTALVVQGLLQLVHSARGGHDSRVTGIIGAMASIVAGAVTFSWPVLTLALFRLALGAWFVFFGLQLLHRVFSRAPDSPRGRRTHRALDAGWTRAIGAGLALILAVGAAAGSAWLLGGVPLPAPGSFYTPPAAVPDAPGRLLRAEALTAGVPRGTEGWRILYTTTHADGTPAVASGTVLAPLRRGEGTRPLVSVAHGTTGVAPKCAPSLSAAPFQDGAEAALTDLVMEHGWVAVTSDYVGLGTAGPHPYLLGEAEARNVLDATRAVQEFDAVQVSSQTVVWGHSQGGQAALWTGEIAAAYAPEITVSGVAALAPAADLYGLAEVNKDDAAGKTVSAYIAATWGELFPELELEAQLTPGSASGVNHIRDLCFNGRDVIGAVLHGTQIPNQLFPDALLDGDFGRLLREQTPEGPFPAPVLVAQGSSDPLVRSEQQRAWVAARCADGASIEYREYAERDHLSLVAKDSPLTPELVEWTLDRESGAQVEPGCFGLDR